MKGPGRRLFAALLVGTLIIMVVAPSDVSCDMPFGTALVAFIWFLWEAGLWYLDRLIAEVKGK